jgi:hypothetical protein
MPSLRYLPALLLCVLLLAPALAQPPAEPGVLNHWDFENTTGPWISINPNAILGLTAAQENVLAGTSALEVQYLFQPGATGGEMISGNAVLPTEGGLPGLAALSLGVRTSETVNVVVGGRETEGGAYLCPVFSPAGVWQKVTLSLKDLVPVEEMPDPDGKLEPEHLQGLAIIDGSVFLSQMMGKLPVAGFAPGARRMWLDEVKLLSTDLPPETVNLPVGSPEAVVIDSCDREAIRWIVLGGKDWKAGREADKGAETGHYRFDYTLPGGTLVVWLKGLHPGQLADTKALHLSARSDQALKLFVGVQEKGKARYSKQIELAAEDDWRRFDLPWGEFTLDKDSRDDDGKLDIEQINMLSLADLSGPAGRPEDRRTILWLDDVYATK